MEGSGIARAKAFIRENTTEYLCRAGLTKSTVSSWIKAQPRFTGAFKRDSAAAAKYWRRGAALLAKLPKKPRRSDDEEYAAGIILLDGRRSREEFLTQHAEAVYRKLTKNLDDFVRVEKLCYDAAKLVPGLTPTRDEVDAESEGMQSEKDGVEVDQGIFLANVLANEATGTHLVHAMLRPKAEAIEQVEKFCKTGLIDFGRARLERKGKAAIVTIQNPRFLNAEDDDTHRRYGNRRGLGDHRSDERNLRVARRPGRASEIRGPRCFLQRHQSHAHLSRQDPVPLVHHARHGHRQQDAARDRIGARSPDEVYGGTREKPWVAQLDTFAIGGGCQYLLVMDYVVAGSDAYMTLPARKEGIIPGAANLRFPPLRRPAHRAAGDHDGQAHRLRFTGRPHGLRSRRAAGRGRAN